MHAISHVSPLETQLYAAITDPTEVMNPSNSATSHHSPLVDDPLESKVGWLSSADPLYLLLTPLPPADPLDLLLTLSTS